MHTYQLFSTVSDELVAVDSHDESCDHCLYSRHPLHMINQSKHKWLFCIINIIFLIIFLNETARYEEKKIIQDPDGGWMSFHALKRIHHGLTAVLFGKGAKTVECNYRYLKSAHELAVKYILKICSPVIHLHDICPESYLKIIVWNQVCRVLAIGWVKSFCAAGGRNDFIEGRQRALMSALPVWLHRTMDLSDQICWSEHPSAVFLNK